MDQCVQGEGLVQINVQIKTSQKHINIVDVLKPAEEYTECYCKYKKLKLNNWHLKKICKIS